MRIVRWVAVYLFLGLAGCATAVSSARTSQPNPLAMPADEVLRESKHLHIAVKDMDIPRAFRMYQSAWFSVVSRDRLRFHVVLVHKWQEFTDVRTWKAHLEDDAGHVFYPEAAEAGKNQHTGQVWDYERRTAQYNVFGDVVGTRNDAYKQRVALDKVDLFKGQGDVVFHSEDLLDQNVKRLTLVLERDGIAYRFTWDLYDPRHGGFREETEPAEPVIIESMHPQGVERTASGNAYPR